MVLHYLIYKNKNPVHMHEAQAGAMVLLAIDHFLASCVQQNDTITADAKAMFTLYRIGFCSVSKVAPVQCEQELMSCCGAEIVPKRSHCEQKPYPSCNLQRSLLIWKDNLPKRGSVAISAPIKVFRLDSDRLKNLSDTECSTFNSGAEQYCSRAETASKAAFLVWTEALSGTLSEMLRFTIRYSVNIA